MSGVRVGVLGGTFNPVHLGHLRAAEEVAEQLGLERVLLVPSAEPPHKEDKELAPAELRLAWVQAAVADNPLLEADPIEIERGGRSYSVETLRDIAARVAPEKPVFVIGHDAFELLGTWREPEALFTLAHFAVVARPPESRGSLADWLPRCARDLIELDADGQTGHHREADTWVRRVTITGLDVSASEIRARLHAGRSIRYLVPEAVRAQIAKSGAYPKKAGSGETGSRKTA